VSFRVKPRAWKGPGTALHFIFFITYEWAQ
jgi:hypothetical protein